MYKLKKCSKLFVKRYNYLENYKTTLFNREIMDEKGDFLAIFDKIKKKEIIPNEVSIDLLLKSCNKDVNNVKEAIEYMKNEKIIFTSQHISLIIENIFEQQEMEGFHKTLALKYLDDVVPLNYYSIPLSYYLSVNPKKGLDLFDSLDSGKYKIGKIVRILIDYLYKNRNFERLKLLIIELEKIENKSVDINNNLIKAYFGTNMLEKAQKLFNSDIEKNEWTYFNYIFGLYIIGKTQEALEIYQTFKIKPTNSTLLKIYLYNMAISMYCKVDMEFAEKEFNNFLKEYTPNATIFNVLLKGYVSLLKERESLLILQRMKLAKVQPDRDTYNELFKLYKLLNFPKEVKKYFEKIQPKIFHDFEGYLKYLIKINDTEGVYKTLMTLLKSDFKIENMTIIHNSFDHFYLKLEFNYIIDILEILIPKLNLVEKKRFLCSSVLKNTIFNSSLTNVKRVLSIIETNHIELRKDDYVRIISFAIRMYTLDYHFFEKYYQIMLQSCPQNFDNKIFTIIASTLQSKNPDRLKQIEIQYHEIRKKDEDLKNQ